MFIVNTKTLQGIVKGFANHRRIEIMELLDKNSGLSVTDISERLKVNLKTISEHIRRLTASGLVIKKYKGAAVLHSLSPLGLSILKFLRTLE
jgi:DNA-binding transcriptional ArsR family regulator